MLDKSIPVDIRPLVAGNAVEQVYCGALLVNELGRAPLMNERIEVV